MSKYVERGSYTVNSPRFTHYYLIVLLLEEAVDNFYTNIYLIIFYLNSFAHKKRIHL